MVIFLQITGQYSVLLPDGRVQTVTYSVRPETGFVVSCFISRLLWIAITRLSFICPSLRPRGPTLERRPSGLESEVAAAVVALVVLVVEVMVMMGMVGVESKRWSK